MRPAWPLRSSLTLVALPTAPLWAQRLATEKLVEWRLSHLSQTVELLVSALVTNATRAIGGLEDDAIERYEKKPLSLKYSELAPTQFVRVQLSYDGRMVLIEVWDSNKEPPAAKEEDLKIVNRLAGQWNYYFPPHGGKVIWCKLNAAGSDP